MIIFLGCEDDFVFLRADISQEIQLRNENLENDLSPISDSAFSAVKYAILCRDHLRSNSGKCRDHLRAFAQGPGIT